MMKRLWIALAFLFAALPGRAEIKTRTFDYADAETTLEGEFFYDDAASGPRPAVLVYHQWAGPTDHERGVARRLASQGYVALVADMYGKGVRPADPESRMAEVTKYRSDRLLMRYRAQASLRALREQKEADGARVAAVGFCFGGGVVLELARSGADVRGVVSIHGNLDTPDIADARNIKGKVLVLHGADDPYVPAEQVSAFQTEMRNEKVDWQMNVYGGAVHAFTQKEAGNDPTQGVAYNESAAARAWRDMDGFLADVLK